MPREISNPGLLASGVKPFLRGFERMACLVAVARFCGNHDWAAAIAAGLQSGQGRQCRAVQRNVPNGAMFASWDGDLAAFKVNAVPIQPLLFALPHSGVQAQVENWHLVRIP